jgi:hypothetical protein
LFRTVALLLAYAALSAALSIKLQGFAFGVGNNIFHIPIFEKWSSEPAFAGEPFIRTLQYYVSGVWALLRALPLSGHTEAVFQAGHFVARCATMLVLGCMAVSMGLRRRAACALLLWFALTPILRTTSPVGAGELFIGYFTHTELTLPMALLSFLFASRGKWAWAFVSLGLIFDVNVFVAVWTAAALAVSLAAASRRSGNLTGLASRALPGLVAAAAIAAPVAVWTFVALTKQPPHPPFDYVEYLRSYYPNHFLIDVAAPADVALVLGIAVTSVVVFRLALASDVWWPIVLGLLGVFLSGAVLPFLTHNPALLNLHLLRVDSTMIAVAIAVSAIVAAGRITSPAGAQRIAGAGALLLLSMNSLAGIVFAELLLAGSAKERWTGRTRLWLAIGCAAALGGGLAGYPRQVAAGAVIAPGLLALMRFPSAAERMAPALTAAAVLALMVAVVVFGPPRMEVWSPDWPTMQTVSEAAVWARGHTAPASTFLVPLRLDPDFGLLAKRRVWVNWKEGAAVMWAPYYYPIWSSRMKEVAALPDLRSREDYACGRHLDYIVARESRGESPRYQVVFQNADLRILRVPESCLAKSQPDYF